MTQKSSFVTIDTISLRERLNRVYEQMRSNKFKLHHFHDLWDLKEMALLQSEPTLMIPAHWWNEVESCESRKLTTH